jgi:hypothetical protein
MPAPAATRATPGITKAPTPAETGGVGAPTWVPDNDVAGLSVVDDEAFSVKATVVDATGTDSIEEVVTGRGTVVGPADTVVVVVVVVVGGVSDVIERTRCAAAAVAAFNELPSDT